MKVFLTLLYLFEGFLQAATQSTVQTSEFHLRGDYLIGGLFNIHYVAAANFQRPQAIDCSRWVCHKWYITSIHLKLMISKNRCREDIIYAMKRFPTKVECWIYIVVSYTFINVALIWLFQFKIFLQFGTCKVLFVFFFLSSKVNFSYSQIIGGFSWWDSLWRKSTTPPPSCPTYLLAIRCLTIARIYTAFQGFSNSSQSMTWSDPGKTLPRVCLTRLEWLVLSQALMPSP